MSKNTTTLIFIIGIGFWTVGGIAVDSFSMQIVSMVAVACLLFTIVFVNIIKEQPNDKE